MLLKIPTQIYHPLMRDMHQMARMQIINCQNREIKSLCKHILSIYLREQTTLQQAIDCHNKSLKQGTKKSPLSYESIIKEELTFLLTNLESDG